MLEGRAKRREARSGILEARSKNQDARGETIITFEVF
jgi:hypothetical protein